MCAAPTWAPVMDGTLCAPPLSAVTGGGEGGAADEAVVTILSPSAGRDVTEVDAMPLTLAASPAGSYLDPEL